MVTKPNCTHMIDKVSPHYSNSDDMKEVLISLIIKKANTRLYPA